MTNLIVKYDMFKKDISSTLNKYIDDIPAVFIAEHLDKITKQFEQLSNSQLKQAQYKESEDNVDGR